MQYPYPRQNLRPSPTPRGSRTFETRRFLVHAREAAATRDGRYRGDVRLGDLLE